MKRFVYAGLATVFAASPAFALKVTNLDSVPHRVLFEAAGGRQMQEIAPNDTTYFPGAPQGMLSLVSAAPVRPSKGALHADGIFAGIIGDERNQGVPADPRDVFVIWPGGHLNLQKRMIDNRHR